MFLTGLHVMTGYEQVKAVLQSLQQTMNLAGHWSDIAVSTEALSSQQPFCMDTMNFSQWLQFVFIPKMLAMIETNEVLPTLVKGQGIEPMASEVYKNTDADRAIITLIRQLDDLLQD
jgi:uncharacterized protein YqcC (DUF446 family)